MIIFFPAASVLTSVTRIQSAFPVRDRLQTVAASSAGRRFMVFGFRGKGEKGGGTRGVFQEAGFRISGFRGFGGNAENPKTRISGEPAEKCTETMPSGKTAEGRWRTEGKRVNMAERAGGAKYTPFGGRAARGGREARQFAVRSSQFAVCSSQFAPNAEGSSVRLTPNRPTPHGPPPASGASFGEGSSISSTSSFRRKTALRPASFSLASFDF